eukprot:TRINITY_DN18_c0_g1_i2.p1 TRINITY_DN18_c0_g1~~TRINITY_DN18_c0_g1_i2.p1  ORF type:complete len:527 (-),score=52.11 TRINITY_DN18_c0_g1_i2:1813-3393(-)
MVNNGQNTLYFVYRPSFKDIVVIFCDLPRRNFLQKFCGLLSDDPSVYFAHGMLDKEVRNKHKQEYKHYYYAQNDAISDINYATPLRLYNIPALLSINYCATYTNTISITKQYNSHYCISIFIPLMPFNKILYYTRTTLRIVSMLVTNQQQQYPFMEAHSTMKAIARNKTGKDSPFLATFPIPKPIAKHVVIKVMASPINPSDEYFAKGNFGDIDHEPYVCGFEGAGIITEVGEGVPHDVVGKKVAAWYNMEIPTKCVGMWSQFAMVPYEACIFLGEADNPEEYCGAFVNPLTLLGFIRIAKETGVKALVHTAAMSSLGKMLIKTCKVEGINVIGVIRKKEDLKPLLDLGAAAALDLTDPKFIEHLRETTEKFNAKLVFDAIGGDMTPALVKGIPDNSVIYVYGMLSGKYEFLSEKFEQLVVVQDEMKKRNIHVKSFAFTNDKVFNDAKEYKKAMGYIQEDVNNGGKLFKLNVMGKYKLEEFAEALENYKKGASQGKSIFLPNSQLMNVAVSLSICIQKNVVKFIQF